MARTSSFVCTPFQRRASTRSPCSRIPPSGRIHLRHTFHNLPVSYDFGNSTRQSRCIFVWFEYEGIHDFEQFKCLYAFKSPWIFQARRYCRARKCSIPVGADRQCFDSVARANRESRKIRFARFLRMPKGYWELLQVPECHRVRLDFWYFRPTRKPLMACIRRRVSDEPAQDVHWEDQLPCN